MRIQQSVVIEAPPERIWPFFVEPEKILKWCITFQKFEYTGEQRGGVGTSFYVEEKASGPLMRLSFEVTEWVDNHRLAFRMTSPTSMVKAYEQTWALESAPSGSAFTFMEEVNLRFGILGSLMERMAKGRSEAAVEEMLGKLKSLAEA